MRRTSILAVGSTLLVALALVAAGCGGGSKSSATTEAAATTETTTEAATTSEASTTTEATTTEATTTEATTTTDLSGIASAGNCKELADLGQKFSQAFSGAASSQDIKKEAELLKEFAAKTPDDIRPDFQVYADFVAKLADAYGNLKPGSTPDPAAIAKLQKLSTSIDQTKLTAAGEHITTWLQNNCRS
jgi:hypothetical protein